MATKEEEEKKLEETEKKKPILQNIPIGYLIAAAIIIIIVLRSVQVEGSGQQIYIVLLILGLLYIVSQATKKEDIVLSPKLAELNLWRDLERKKQWKQIPLMAKYKVGPVGDMIHKDERGLYYNIGTEIKDPYDVPQYGVGKVMAKGPEKGFATLINAIRPLNGWEIEQQRTVGKMSNLLKDMKKEPILEKLFFH